MEPPQGHTNYPAKSQEHVEASQNEINQAREIFLQSLSEADQKKFKAVEQASKIMMDAGIIFFLHPFLPCSSDSDKKIFWQWNSLIEHVQYDKGGIRTKESSQMIMETYMLLQDSISKTMMKYIQFKSWEEYFEFVLDSTQYSEHRLFGDRDKEAE